MTVAMTLVEIRRALLFEVDNEWRSTTELHQAISNRGHEWYRTALVLERLAADGLLELRVRGRVRRFRRHRITTPIAESAGRGTA